jgi:hypothetical protein
MKNVSTTENICNLNNVCEAELLGTPCADAPLQPDSFERAFNQIPVSVSGNKAVEKPPITVYGTERLMNNHLHNVSVSQVIFLLQVKVALQRQGRTVVLEIPRSIPAHLPTFDLISNISMDGVTYSIIQQAEIGNALGIPQVATLTYMRSDKVSKLLREVLDGSDDLVCCALSTTCKLTVATAPVKMTTFEDQRTAVLSFGDWFSIRCKWSDLGNFLHARKTHGDEVALATLHCIASKS